MDVLSSSPTSSMLTDLLPYAMEETEGEITLEEFVEALPAVIRQRKRSNEGTLQDPIRKLFDRVRLEHDDWERFAYFDHQKNYTRNLVATDHETFTLLLLCWTPGRESPIHDHPCDGCWMRVLDGQVREVRYRHVADQESEQLVCTEDRTFDEGIVFIEDSQGYHKVGNPSLDRQAVTLHLSTVPELQNLAGRTAQA